MKPLIRLRLADKQIKFFRHRFSILRLIGRNFYEDVLTKYHYVGTYLREEIAAEGLTRNVPAFARFLEVAAACNGRMINKTEVANDAKVPRTTVNEYFLFHELKTWTDTRKPGFPLHYWRSTSGFEVDFILGGHTAIEVKATVNASKRDFKGLEALAEEGQMKRLILVCQEGAPRQVGPVLVLPWRVFLEQLWDDAFAD